MNAFAISLVAFFVMLAGAMTGAVLHRILPQSHLDDQSKDIVRLGSALIATISALVLGLLITSAKNTYDLQRNEVRQITSKLVLTDTLLERYGPQTRPARDLLRRSIPPMITRIWGQRAVTAGGAPFAPSLEGHLLYGAIETLTPQNEVQRTLKFQAMQTVTTVTEERILLFEQSDAGLPLPLLVVLIFWLTILLASFTLFSSLSPTGAVALVIIALSAAGAIFLILEMNLPFDGLMQIPSAPLRDALGVLG
ncbi:hypothetical protein BH11PSE3_BH11PSE3_28150 [soil metagenome]